MVAKAKKYIKQNCKSKEQMGIVTTFLQYFQAIGPHFQWKHHELPSNVTPPLELLTGQPGAGKSTVVKMIMHVANLLQAGHIASTSFNGIAAVNVFGGTICNVFNVQPSYDMNIWNQALQSFTVRGQILKGIRE
jgi:predicted ATPase